MENVILNLLNVKPDYLIEQLLIFLWYNQYQAVPFEGK